MAEEDAYVRMENIQLSAVMDHYKHKESEV
jgi:hypothetical protein